MLDHALRRREVGGASIGQADRRGSEHGAQQVGLVRSCVPERHKGDQRWLSVDFSDPGSRS